MGNQLEGLRVLNVGHDRELRQLYALTLQGQGATVTSVATPAEANEVLSDWTPDVLISGLVFAGDQDGYQFIAALRKSAGDACRVPAVALTACGPEVEEQVLAAGFDKYVKVPVTSEQLVEAVASLSPGIEPRPEAGQPGRRHTDSSGPAAH